MMSENLSKSMKEESEILRIRDEITEFDLKLKNFGYEKQNFLQNIENEVNRNFIKINQINNKLEKETDLFREQYFRLMDEKNNLILKAKALEEQILKKNVKLHDLVVSMKKKLTDERLQMLEEEKLMSKISLLENIKKKLSYEELLRLFILETFSVKLNNVNESHNLLNKNFEFLIDELKLLFQNKQLIQDILNFLNDYLNENISQFYLENMIFHQFNQIIFKEIENFFFSLAKNVENLIKDHNSHSFNTNICKINLKKIVLFLKIVFKLNIHQMTINSFQNFIDNEYITIKLQIRDDSRNFSQEIKKYASNHSLIEMQKIEFDHQKNIDLTNQLKNEMEILSQTHDCKIKNFNYEIDLILEDNQKLQKMRRETCDYIDQQTNLIIEHCEKCKEKLYRKYPNYNISNLIQNYVHDYGGEKVNSNYFVHENFRSSPLRSNLESQEHLSEFVSDNNNLDQNLIEFKNKESNQIIVKEFKNPNANCEENKTDPVCKSSNKYINNYQMMKETPRISFNKLSIGKEEKEVKSREDRSLNFFKNNNIPNIIFKQASDNKSKDIISKITKPLHDNIIRNDKFKLKVNFHFHGCQSETFVKLEKIRTLLEGLRIFKRVNFVNGQILPDYDPFSRIEMTAESLGFSKYFFYLTKQIDKVVFEKLTEPTISSAINVMSFHSIFVPNSTKSLIILHKINEQLKRKSESFKDYLVKHQKSFDNDEFLKLLKNDEKLTIRCLNNTFFQLHILIKNGLRLEVIASSYSDFKYILNGLNILLKEFDYIKKLSDRIVQNLN